MSETYAIHLGVLKRGVGRFPAEYGPPLHDSAVVAFEKTIHYPPVACGVQDQGTPLCSLVIDWSETPTPSRRRFLENHLDFTRFGAEGIALLMVEALTDYSVVEQSQVGTGVDFRLGNKARVISTGDDDFVEATARLEVSGILRATNANSIRRRVTCKLEQSTKSDHENTPVFVVVMEFSRPEANFTERYPPDARQRET